VAPVEPVLPLPDEPSPDVEPAPLAMVGIGELEDEPQPDTEIARPSAAVALRMLRYVERFMMF
jgi:hypothetical protein